MHHAAIQVLYVNRLIRRLKTCTVRYRSHLGLHVIIRGRARVVLDGRCHDLRGDWLWAGLPGTTVTYAAAGEPPAIHYQVAVAGDGLGPWLAEGLWPREPLAVHDAPRLQRHLDRLLEAMDGDAPPDTRARANALEAILLDAHRQQRDARSLPTWILDLQAHLEGRWREPHYDVHELAARYRMPVATLRRTFAARVGQPLHTWYLHLRHRRIAGMLLEADAPLADVAARCGFADVSYFSRAFKRLAGISPKEYRRSAYA